ncbi:maleylpyruvate isomerase family mycothiol-dependent enzyme [Streptomyces coeruleorubidus]|uniref:Maleylpyruvate isomerase family mycothiol-dependent enzyme n=1 Tax=Streptomyces coeruleorubidus TaxID=116188 RepID=A0A5J6HYH0_STRC4|nr:maleylpyruvate isomerase family mycothiol-dependent enzyme [Streptomyces coeruleorubidus]QEV23451.1 maleylpyruvate isomerase family mycothiol-dependent enzyme [Streptomyces coeruleorubidus]GGU09367.1 maleylpyruvate isomerase [Streptomyces coeruleorubidus]
MSARPAAMLERAAKGTAAFEAAVHRLTDAGLTRPSYLPGWSRAHVVAHVARNADALVNLMTWARTGVETPMYTSADQRADGIEDGARRRAGVLREELLAADGRLAEAFAGLPDECWGATVRTARGREVPASQVPWMRVREVWVHTVDLNITTFDDVPHEVCAALVDDVAAAFRARPDCPSVELRTESDVRTWLLGAPGGAEPVAVSGDLPSLAAYATGRPVPGPLYPTGGESLPKLPAWL